jgi:hypothetical protein
MSGVPLVPLQSAQPTSAGLLPKPVASKFVKLPDHMMMPPVGTPFVAEPVPPPPPAAINRRIAELFVVCAPDAANK